MPPPKPRGFSPFPRAARGSKGARSGLRRISISSKAGPMLHGRIANLAAGSTVPAEPEEVRELAALALSLLRAAVGPEADGYAPLTRIDLDAGEVLITARFLPGKDPDQRKPDLGPVFSGFEPRFVTKALARQRAKGALLGLPPDCAHCAHWSSDPVEPDGEEHRCAAHTTVNHKGQILRSRLTRARQTCDDYEAK